MTTMKKKRKDFSREGAEKRKKPKSGLGREGRDVFVAESLWSFLWFALAQLFCLFLL